MSTLWRVLYALLTRQINPNISSMKKTLLTLFGMVAVSAAIAQPQFENQGFEGWDGIGTNNREPVDWNSIKTGGGNASTPNAFVVDRSTTVRPGTGGIYSAMLETKNVFVIITNVTINGVMTNGRLEAPTLSAADGYIRSKVDDEAFYTAMTDRPDSLVAWVNYQPSGNDNGSFDCIMHDIQGTGLTAGNMGSLPESGNSQGNNTAQVIGQAGHTFTANTGGWVRTSVPFAYVDQRTPQYILFTATSSGQSGAVNGSKMYIDDLGLIYNITPSLSDVVAPVTATEGFPLTVNFSTPGTPLGSTSFVAELSDASGSFANPVVIGTLASDLASGSIAAEIPANTPAGAGYKIRVTYPSQFYASLETGIEVTQDVVGLAEAMANAVKVYGANGLMTVDLTGVKLESPTMELFTLSGQRIASGRLIEGQQNRIDLSGQNGMFIVRILDADNAISKKVLVD
jgi:hypothetical protein